MSKFDDSFGEYCFVSHLVGDIIGDINGDIIKCENVWDLIFRMSEVITEQMSFWYFVKKSAFYVKFLK